MKRLLFVTLPLVLLAASPVACASLTPVSPADVDAIEVSVTIAETLALNYTKLPACPTASKVCADPATKTSVKLYGQKAHDAVRALELSSSSGAPAALAAAQSALAAFQASIPVTTPAPSTPTSSTPVTGAGS